MSIRHDQIPQKVVEAAARMLCKADGRLPDAVVGPDGMRGFRAWEKYKPQAYVAIVAALAAWPGMVAVKMDTPLGEWTPALPGIILPLEPSE